MDGKRKCPTLAENKEEADIVRMIFDLYVNKDMGTKRICNHLESLAVKPPKGDHWSPETLQDMVSNVHYIGKVKWNWRKTVTIVENSEIIKTRPKAQIGEFLVYEGKHEAIISEELFNAAQEKRGRNHRAKPTTKIRNPFAGLIRCRCGRAMSLRTYTAHAAAPRLLCDGQSRCNSGSCLYSEMIERVSAILQDCIHDFEIRLQNNEGDSVKLHMKLVKSLEKRMEELKEKEISQWEMQSHPDLSQRMPPEIFKRLNERLLKEKEDVQQALCKAYESIPEPVDYEKKIRTFDEALKALHNPEVDAEKKNKLLKACIERITYSREKGNRWTDPPIEIKVDLR